MKAVKRMLEPLRQRVMLMVAKAIVKLVEDGGELQRLQVALLAGEVRNAATRIQNYGHSAYPFAGSLALVVFPGGNRDHPLVAALDDPRYRPRDLREGEVTLYDDLGQRVWLTRDGIVIEAANLPVTIKNAPKVRCETPMFECTGEIKDRSDTDGMTMSGMRSVYNDHHHPGDSGGITGTPNEEMVP